MNITRPILYALVLLAGLAWQVPASAQDANAVAGQYSKEGADTCLGCHDEEDANYAASTIFKSRHAHRGDKRAPFGAGGLQCEACHGPGALHARNKKAESINSLKADSSQPVAQRNQTCLGCHENAARTGWHASAHERGQVACADCHSMHKRSGDPMLAKSSEPQACLGCHKQQRADFQKTSSHPVRQGLMGCSDCHSAHGSNAPAMLAKPTLNQTCYSCHADKRGPLLWEHAPVAEDCAQCHVAHGSVRTALLTKNPPQLCQQCHSAAGHPSVARTANALPSSGGAGAAFLIAGGCSNCHSQVHGSNHPSGSKLMR
jgi:DmsE family decaheme c-type cytochrome